MSRGTTPETGVATVGGGNLYYRDAGSGEPLVLVHAGIADNRMWDAQFEALARHYRVVAYDLRGYGRSDTPTAPFYHYRDLASLLESFDIESAHLVGASAGGAVVRGGPSVRAIFRRVAGSLAGLRSRIHSAR